MAMHETELEMAEFGEFGEMGEFHETGEMHEDEQFLGGILGSLLGGGEVSPLTQEQEHELAAELLEVSSEEELEQFLGGLVKRIGGALRSPVGRALTGVLKNVAKKALPVVGGALGSMVAPGIGTALGSKLGTMASGLFELELEALPQEQAEFEVARRLVGLTATAARNAAAAKPRRGVGPQTVARAAVAKAARAYAPGLHRQLVRTLKTSVRPGPVPARQPGRPRPVVAASQPAPVPVRRHPGRPYGVPVPVTYQPTFVPGGYWDGDDGIEPSYDDSADWPEPYGVEPAANGGLRTSGRWIRRGRKILLLEV